MAWDDVLDSIASAVPDGVGAGRQIVGGTGDDRIEGTEGSDEILADPVPADDQGGDDEVWGYGGDDRIRAFGGDNRVFGGRGDDAIYAADGRDELWGGYGNDELQGGRGSDHLFGGPGDDEVRGGEDDDLLFGGPGDDRVIGSSGNDVIAGDDGHDALEGREGQDAFVWADAGGGVDRVLDFDLGLDRLVLGDLFAGAVVTAANLGRYVRLDAIEPGGPAALRVDPDGGGAAPWRELAVLTTLPGLDATALHLVGDLGLDGQPAPPPFSGLDYIASHGDLIAAFGADAVAGKRHYVLAGHAEGRSADAFDEVQYVANYPDLQAAFGTDYAAATRHYITNGYAEGRTDQPLDGSDFMM